MSSRLFLLVLWVILFVVGILLIVSGTKTEKKSTKTILSIFGPLLILVSIFLFLFTFFFGFNS